jgi:hypothetical protein
LAKSGRKITQIGKKQEVEKLMYGTTRGKSRQLREE